MNEAGNTHAPLVSVIVPVHNGERTLQQALESVFAQTYKRVEIIIVDDGSTDGTARLVAGLADRVSYFFLPHSGAAAARNLGIRESKGEFIAFIDADDLWVDGKLAAQMRCFEAFPQVEIVQGLVKRIRLDESAHSGERGVGESPIVFSNLGAMVVRRSVFERIGYLDEALRYNEDTDFWLRALEAGMVVLVQRKLALLYRLHGRSLTAGADAQTLGIAGVIRRSMLRRRQASGAMQAMGKLLSFSDLDRTGSRQQPLASKQREQWPLLSVILYFRGGFEDPAPPVLSLIDQDYPGLEVLVVAPQPDLLQLPPMDAFRRLEIVAGVPDLASGLNTALESCRGAMVAFLDAAGEWTADKLKFQVRHLLEHPGDEYVVGRTRHILVPDLAYPAQLIEGLALRKGVGDLLPTLLARRSTFSRLGGFRSDLAGMEETDWILRAKDAGIPNRMLAQVAFFRLVRPDAYRLAVDDAKRALLASVRLSIDRKRGAFPQPS